MIHIKLLKEFFIIRIITKKMKIVILIVAMAIFCLSPHEYNDTTMFSNFIRNRHILDDILNDFNQDRNIDAITKNYVYTNNDWSWPRPRHRLGISEDRWSRYKVLLDLAGIKYGIWRGEYGVYFSVNENRLFMTGDVWGYLHATKQPEPVLMRFEGHWDEAFKSIIFKPIVGNWYIFYMTD